VKRAYISITPIHVDLTRYQALDQVAGWVAELSMDGAAAMERDS
jgi:5'-nucleotidase